MNYIQLILFAVYFFSVFLCGMFIYQLLGRDYSHRLNKAVLLGEALLLGSIFVIGQLLLLSLLQLYKAPYLWGCIILNCLLIFKKEVRQGVRSLFAQGIRLDLPLFIFVSVILIWAFRNYFPLIETDSVSAYLFFQKLWLSKGTSLIGGPLSDSRLFIAHFDCVPYSLGISIFPRETLFPQFINIFSRFIALILVFGYTSYRFNRWYGLAGAMFVLFNEHFFYSGVATCLIVNGSVVALSFASVYNFWESRRQNSSFRFLLALIFASQIMANKYQMAYVLFFMLFVCFFIQRDILAKFKEIIKNKRWVTVLLGSCLILSFWFVRNLIITGDPLFPILAGKLGIFNWSPEKDAVCAKWLALHLKPTLFLKYMTYMFIWPGVSALKYIIVTILLLPFILGFLLLKSKFNAEKTLELLFWLSVSVVSIFGISLAGWTSVKFYRYPIGIFSFSAVFILHYLFTQLLRIKNQLILSACIVFLASSGGRNESWRVIFRQAESFHFPTYKENLDTLFNKIHADYALNSRHSWCNPSRISELLRENKEKLNRTAWDLDSFSHALPVFFFQDLPVVSVWVNSVIKWDSRNDPELILRDLKISSIDWVITRGPELLSAEAFAKRAALRNYSPKTTYYDHEFPEELSRIR